LQDKKAFEQAGIDPRKESEIFRQHYKQAYIIDKHVYKHGIVLIVNVCSINGAIYTLPYTYVEEYGKWKLTNKFAGDDELMQYMEYIPPPTLTASTKIRPKRWSIDLYNWINENLETSRLAQFLAEKLTILCLIKDLKDSEGNSYSVNDIARETILLNGIVHTQTWKFKEMEKTALVQDPEGDDKLKEKKGFDEWSNNDSFIKNSRRPFMLVRFNMFKSMGTLPDMNPGEKHDIEITGRLKDEKVFKGTAKIELKAMRKGDKKDLKNSILFNAEQDLHNWWNHEPGLEKRWKSIRDGKMDKNSPGHE